MKNKATSEWLLASFLQNIPDKAEQLRVDQYGNFYWSNISGTWCEGASGPVYHRDLLLDAIIAEKFEIKTDYLSKQDSIRNKLINQGVTLYDPARVDVRGTLTTGDNVVIDVNVIFNGNVNLGNNVKIGPNCIINDCQIDDDVTIEANSILDSSIVQKGAQLGPYARLRPETVIKEKAKIGNFVEVKKSIVGSYSKVNHFSYIGDATIGEKVNVGAGVITANYDGVNKFKTVIGNNAFIGTNSTLIAPVTISDNAFVAAGSAISQNIENDQLAIARGKQRNIDGWERPKK
jgi:bifunctional UDP-N-acetylglucosamine pyrophosphorylase / glucosamine-1-phosphate N-acetyltransferase